MESRSQTRTDFSRGEAVSGLVWLSVGAAFSLLLEVVYLGTWITLPGGARVALPYTIVIAFLFNWVLTRTAKLWTDNIFVAAVPLYVWLAGFLVLLLGVEITGDQMMGNNIRTILLLMGGIAGAVWPLLHTK